MLGLTQEEIKDEWPVEMHRGVEKFGEMFEAARKTMPRDQWEEAVRKSKEAKDWEPQKQVAYATGAVRSADAESTRYDLITPIGLRRVAEACAEGAKKYADYNWEKGMPILDLLNHAIRHVYLFLAGDRSEDHLGHAGWNLLAACHSDEQWPELNQNTLRTHGCKPPTQ